MATDRRDHRRVRGRCGHGRHDHRIGPIPQGTQPEIEIVGADPAGSIYSAGPGDEIHQYKVEGVGEDFYPETVDLDLIDRFIRVTDTESFAMTRRLARVEGLLVGGSCGMAAHAAIQVASEDTTKLVVVLLPDSGRGYLEKIFNDDWMRANGFGAILEE